jgi:hypothetical protein
VSLFPRQRSRRVTVDELLARTTGDDVVPDNAVRHRLDPRARPDGGREKRDVLRRCAAAAAVVAAVCLTAFAATSKPTPTGSVAAAPPLSEEPAISEPPASVFTGTAPAPSPSPSPSTSAPATPPTSAPVTPPATPAPPPHRAPATTSAVPAPAPVVVSCTVRFTITDSWPGGFTASVGITNTGSSPVSPWTLTWTFTAGQQVTHGWDGEYTQSGNRVTVHPASYNPTIAASATTNIGFNGSYSGTNPAPVGFTLNGTRCGRSS